VDRERIAGIFFEAMINTSIVVNWLGASGGLITARGRRLFSSSSLAGVKLYNYRLLGSSYRVSVTAPADGGDIAIR
jgi:hypothetical protein